MEYKIKVNEVKNNLGVIRFKLNDVKGNIRDTAKSIIAEVKKRKYA